MAMAGTHVLFNLLHAPGTALAHGVLFAALAVAAYTDLFRNRRIPNLVTFPAIAVGLCLHAVTFGLTGFLSSLVAFLAWFVTGFCFYAASGGRGIGAGDVKMLAAAAALWGFWPAFWLYFASNLAQVFYLFLRWIYQGTIGENLRRMGTWIFSTVAPGTKIVHFEPAGMKDTTPHAPFMLLGAALVVLLDKYGVLPW